MYNAYVSELRFKISIKGKQKKIINYNLVYKMYYFVQTSFHINLYLTIHERDIDLKSVYSILSFFSEAECLLCDQRSIRTFKMVMTVKIKA